MADRWPLCPFAEWRPWRYRNGSQTYYYKDQNDPIAAVIHIMAGNLWTGWDWPENPPRPTSWHFTIQRNGHIMQHLRLQDGGFHAGISRYVKRGSRTIDRAVVHTPTWPLWKGWGENVNHFTVGIEHEGIPHGDSLLNFTDIQLDASKRLNIWLAQTLGYELTRERMPAHADIDLLDRVNDFDYPDERHWFYDYVLGDTMANPLNDLLVIQRDLRRLIEGKHPAQPALHKRLRELGILSDPEYTGNYAGLLPTEE